MTSHVRRIWGEPRVPNPPTRVTRDWLVTGVMAVCVLVEGAVRPDLVLRPLAVVVGLVLSVALLWRRAHPLAVVAVMFGAVTGMDVLARILDGAPVELYSSGFLLVTVYTLFRWGSGREAALGVGVMALAFVASVAQAYNGVGDIIGGAIVLLVPAELGGLTRFQIAAREQRIEQAKLHEREQLARELHDTVAHHVSAIVIQAQAGQVLAKSSSLEGAANALAVIEGEAARTLVEMRSIIGLLRDSDVPADMAPQHGLNDIEGLARTVTPEALPIDIEIGQTLGEVSAPVQVAAYRIVQEAITNAQRHSVGASRISVSVQRQAESIRVTIDNDGPPDHRYLDGDGYGIVGMRERAAMIGGTLSAGPRPSGGWSVRADLPRQGAAT